MFSLLHEVNFPVDLKLPWMASIIFCLFPGSFSDYNFEPLVRHLLKCLHLGPHSRGSFNVSIRPLGECPFVGVLRVYDDEHRAHLPSLLISDSRFVFRVNWVVERSVSHPWWRFPSFQILSYIARIGSLAFLPLCIPWRVLSWSNELLTSIRQLLPLSLALPTPWSGRFFAGYLFRICVPVYYYLDGFNFYHLRRLNQLFWEVDRTCAPTAFITFFD